MGYFHECVAGRYTLVPGAPCTQLVEPGWTKRTLFFKPQGDLCSHHTGAKWRVVIVLYFPVIADLSLWLMCLGQTLKTRTFKSECIYGENQKVTAHVQGKEQTLKSSEKTLSLDLKLILGKETAYNNEKHTKTITENGKPWGMGKFDFIVTKLLH